MVKFVIFQSSNRSKRIFISDTVWSCFFLFSETDTKIPTQKGFFLQWGNSFAKQGNQTNTLCCLLFRPSDEDEPKVATKESCKITSNGDRLISADWIPTDVTSESHRFNMRIGLHFLITHSLLLPENKQSPREAGKTLGPQFFSKSGKGHW
jgi:hypothetical protein